MASDAQAQDKIPEGPDDPQADSRYQRFRKRSKATIPFEMVRTSASAKIGIDANAPINARTGEIMGQAVEPSIIAACGAGWVRINFILGDQWASPTDDARPHGLTWAETYDQIIDGFRAKGLKIYGLISNEAVGSPLEGEFRQPPGDNPLDHPWLREYAENFVAIARHFDGRVSIYESFNEPDDWKGHIAGWTNSTPNWIHPGWFAAMLQAVYTAVSGAPDLKQIRLVSGPLQGLEGVNRGNGAPGYLNRTYAAGVRLFGWGKAGVPFPFDGVGYHLYVHEAFSRNRNAQHQQIGSTYRRYLAEMRDVTRKYEGRIKPLYISELGWFTNGQDQDAMEQFQADSLCYGLDALIREPSVALAINFCTQDFGEPGQGKYYGLFRQGPLSTDNRKPAFDAFRELCHQEIDLPMCVDLVSEEPTLHIIVFGPFSHQDLINAFVFAAAALDLDDDWALMTKSGISVADLTADRLAPYQGTPLQALTSLSIDERNLLMRQLDRVIKTMATPPRPNPLDPATERVELAPPPTKRLVSPADGTWQETAVVDNWNKVGGFLLEKADELGIDPAVALAILLTESSGDAFDENGRLVIRFEPHIFYDRWGRSHPELFLRHFRYDPNREWDAPGQQEWRPDPGQPWRLIHQDQNEEWRTFEAARRLDEEQAMCSISMGAPQVMGFNHALIGYGSVQEMFQSFSGSEQSQLDSLFRFIRVNGLVEAIQSNDFLRLATVYNGPAHAQVYADRIHRWIDVYNQVRTTPHAMAIEPAALPLPGNPLDPRPETKVDRIAEHKSIRETDPELYAAWREHIENGYRNNELMFNRILEGFMNPYQTTIWMYRIMFGLGIAAFVAAVVVALVSDNAATAVGGALVFSGLSVVVFLTYFLSRPLQALEENLQFITWLGIIYNTYWTRLTYALEMETFHEEIEDATDDAVAKIKEMLDEHGKRSGARPGLR